MLGVACGPIQCPQKLFALEIPSNDHDAARELLAQITHWVNPPGRTYCTAEATQTGHPLLAGCARAFFIKMPPGARVHKHRDSPGVIDHFDTDHIVVSTNDQALIWWDEDGYRSQHLELGKRYRIRDRGLLHWAVNDGDTDRVHLLIEYRRRVSGVLNSAAD